MLNTAKKLLTHLAKFETTNGLRDPIENSTLPNKYGNSFYSLGCFLLYKETGENIWKIRSTKALKAELRNTENRFKKLEMFRWEFKNYSVLKIQEQNKFPQSKLDKRILTMQNMGSFRTNWIAMRGLNYLLRWKIYKNKNDLKSSKKEIQKVLKFQTREGLFQDGNNDNSFQYHAYVLAILIQYYDITPSEGLKNKIIKGLDLLVKITDPEGNMSYFGRGQQQIFGYASAIYCFSYAYNKFNPKYGPYAKLIFSYVKPFLKKNLILANKDNQVKAGWYKYNYLTDYLSFASTYLLLSHKYIDLKKVKLPKPKEYEMFLESSNVFIKNTPEYFVCICVGNKSKSELPGLNHIYPKVIPCSGGPPVNSLGRDYSFNFLGIGQKNILQNETGRFYRTKDNLKLEFKTKKMNIIYTWDLNKKFKQTLEIIPKQLIKICPIHYVAWNPLDKTPFRREIITPMGIAKEYFEDSITTKKRIKREITIYKGKKEPKKIIQNYNGRVKTPNFKAEKLKHFLTLSFSKLFKNPKDFFYSLVFLYTRNNYKRKSNLLSRPIKRKNKK
jgi:hypothetical protein